MKKGKVIAGDYNNYDVIAYGRKCYFSHWIDQVPLNRKTVLRYEIISDVSKHPFWGTLIKGAISKAIFGNLGMAASVSSSVGRKSFIISIEFRNGKRSLIEIIDDDLKSVLSAIY